MAQQTEQEKEDKRMFSLLIRREYGPARQETDFSDSSPCFKLKASEMPRLHKQTPVPGEPHVKKADRPESLDKEARKLEFERNRYWNQNFLASIGRVLGVWFYDNSDEDMSVIDFCNCIEIALERLKDGIVKPCYEPPLQTKAEWHLRWLVQDWEWGNSQLRLARENMIRAHTRRRLAHRNMMLFKEEARKLKLQFTGDRHLEDFRAITSEVHSLLKAEDVPPRFLAVPNETYAEMDQANKQAEKFKRDLLTMTGMASKARIDYDNLKRMYDVQNTALQSANEANSIWKNTHDLLKEELERERTLRDKLAQELEQLRSASSAGGSPLLQVVVDSSSSLPPPPAPPPPPPVILLEKEPTLSTKHQLDEEPEEPPPKRYRGPGDCITM